LAHVTKKTEFLVGRLPLHYSHYNLLYNKLTAKVLFIVSS